MRVLYVELSVHTHFLPAFLTVTQLRLKDTGSHTEEAVFVELPLSTVCLHFQYYCMCIFGCQFVSKSGFLCLCKSFCVRPIHQKTFDLIMSSI